MTLFIYLRAAEAVLQKCTGSPRGVFHEAALLTSKAVAAKLGRFGCVCVRMLPYAGVEQEEGTSRWIQQVPKHDKMMSEKVTHLQGSDPSFHVQLVENGHACRGGNKSAD